MFNCRERCKTERVGHSLILFCFDAGGLIFRDFLVCFIVIDRNRSQTQSTRAMAKWDAVVFTAPDEQTRQQIEKCEFLLNPQATIKEIQII